MTSKQFTKKKNKKNKKRLANNRKEKEKDRHTWFEQ